ncbi:hypothetical protein BASA81_012832 [Batrachochytrium salamandrivorans]|nr:hypothetical protein BASA81_012832 [Batrachochytrium salamandrivorans]
MGSEEQFLLHLERLGNSQQEAERERARLLVVLAGKRQKLKQAETERDESGRVGASATGARFAHQSLLFEQSNLRRGLEDRLALLLGEYCGLQASSIGEEAENEDTTELLEGLKETLGRLEAGAVYFHSQHPVPVLSLPPSQQALQFELDRGRRKLHALGCELNHAKQKLEQVQQRHVVLTQKLRG